MGDGVITIAMKRKPVRRIPVVQTSVAVKEEESVVHADKAAVSTSTDAQQEQEQERPDESSPPMSDGEWANVERGLAGSRTTMPRRSIDGAHDRSLEVSRVATIVCSCGGWAWAVSEGGARKDAAAI